MSRLRVRRADREARRTVELRLLRRTVRRVRLGELSHAREEG